MKKNILTAIMGMGLVVMASCSGYDEDILNLPPEPQPTQQPTDDNKNDEWETTRDDWFGMNGNIIDTHKTTNKNEYCAYVPFTASLGNDMYLYLSFDEKKNVEFKSLENIATVTPSYGEWSSNDENDSIRTATYSQDFKTNLYGRTLTTQTGEAYRLLNGKKESFLMPTLVNTSYGTTLNDSTRVQRNDSIIDRFTFTDFVEIKFVDKGAIRNDLKPFKVTATTVIEIFIGMKENNENMPTPDITVGEEIISITDRTASPIYRSETQIDWYEVSLVKTTAKTYVVANGKKVAEWKNSDLANANWNSAMYDTFTGKWIPCILQMDPNQTGWTYTFQLADGTARVLSAAMNASLISSLKSFQKNDDAKQTPFLSTAAAVKRSYSDGDLFSVIGLYPYTVGYKF